MKLTDDSECGGGQSVTLIGTPLSLPQLRRWLAVLEPQVEVAEELTLNPVLELDSVSIERAVAARRQGAPQPTPPSPPPPSSCSPSPRTTD